MQRSILVQLRNPTKLRFVICAVLLGSWYLGFYGPTREQMTLTSAKADSELKRTDSARQIEELRVNTGTISSPNPCSFWSERVKSIYTRTY